jgi:hypothetical protein
MHQGRPYGLHVIGGKLTDRDEAFVSVTAKRFSNLKDLASIDSSRMVYDLPDGGYVVIQDMGGNFRVIAHKTSEIALIALDGMATDYIPMLYSGVILNATPFESDGVPIRLTETTRRRLVDYSGSEALPPKEVELHRFRIKYDDKFKYFEPQYKGIRTFTQYHKLRATWYSGAMSEVVQIIGGYGTQDNETLPDELLERKTLKLPLDVTKSIRAYIANQRLPAYTGIPEFEGKYKYDYLHSLSNGVSFDDAGKPWLLRINAAGVYAMPLPVIPATTAPAFREYMIEVGDDEILHVLNRFGGLPSGEIFPTGDDFQAWYRAGAIIKVCGTTDFYQHYAFYAACGWSFNSQGTEGFNTCWSGGGESMRYAHGFKMRLRLGAATDNGWTLNARRIEGEDAITLNNYIVFLFNQLAGNGARELAIRYKVMRTSINELLTHAEAKRDINFWENLISKPIAIHNGTVSEVSKGNLYWGSPNPLSFGALKFPELTGQGCESFDMSMPEYKGLSERCDTVVFGCYVNDQLTVIKYFLDERRFQKSVESSFEKVMIVGQWEETKTNATSGLMGYLYTTAFDDRREASDSTTYTKLTGKDLGYGNPAYSTPSLLYMWGGLSRARYYSFRTEVATVTGDSLSVAVCVPTFTRDSMLYAYSETNYSKSYSDKMERRSVTDPTTYEIWTYDPIFHWIGNGSEAIGEPTPTVGDYVYTVYGSYIVNEYSWFADSGNWYGVSKGSYKDETGRLSKYTDRNSTHPANGVTVGGEAPRLDTYSNTNNAYNNQIGRVDVSITIKGAGNIHKNIPSAFYYDFSPVESGGSLVYFYRDATWITSGTQRYTNIDEKKDNGLRAYWGSTKLVDHKSAHCFIGVINE